jgi:hypothetical protein
LSSFNNTLRQLLMIHYQFDNYIKKKKLKIQISKFLENLILFDINLIKILI